MDTESVWPGVRLPAVEQKAGAGGCFIFNSSLLVMCFVAHPLWGAQSGFC